MLNSYLATGGWPEQENPYTTRINTLIDYHKVLASIEKQQCERKKFHPKRSFMPAVSMTKSIYILHMFAYCLEMSLITIILQ
jgi:hypothetical protein